MTSEEIRAVRAIANYKRTSRLIKLLRDGDVEFAKSGFSSYKEYLEHKFSSSPSKSEKKLVLL